MILSEQQVKALPSLDPPKTVRLTFRKAGRLQYISHLDLQRSMARIIARAGLPVWYTKGFNPHPKLVFGGVRAKSNGIPFSPAARQGLSIYTVGYVLAMQSVPSDTILYSPECFFINFRLSFITSQSSSARAGTLLLILPYC